MSDETERVACGNELREIWGRYGIWTMIQSLADIIEEDTKLVEATGKFPKEAQHKDTMVSLLRKAAGSPVD